MAAQEATGKTVEEATEKALRALGCARDEAHVEVLEVPSKGLFGLFGARPAKVRVTRKADASAEAAAKKGSREEIHSTPVEFVEKPAEAAKAAEPEQQDAEPASVDRADETEDRDRPWQPPEEGGALETPYSEQRSYGVTATTPSVRPFGGAAAVQGEGEGRRPRRRRYEERRAPFDGGQEAGEQEKTLEDLPGVLVTPDFEGVKEEELAPRQRAEKFLFDIFRCLSLDVQMKRREADEGFVYNLQGPGLGILIGKHGQTLDALQYLANLAANKGQEEGRIHVVLDALGYRARREETLRRLATHLAEKACRIHAEVRLEPMNRHERKIIHMALQENRRVSTYSDGDEPYRCVVIAPKKKRRFRPRRERAEAAAPERIEEEE